MTNVYAIYFASLSFDELGLFKTFSRVVEFTIGRRAMDGDISIIH